MRNITLLTLMCLASVIASAQDKWVGEGAFRRYSASFDIVDAPFGCAEGTGNPIVQTATALTEVDVVNGTATPHAKPASGFWRYLPRSPHFMINVQRTENGDSTTIRINDQWLGTLIKTFTLAVNTAAIDIDFNDTWISEDKTVGCIVFAPVLSTPQESAENIAIIFKGDEVMHVLRVKPKNDLDIYVRPDDDYGVLVYLRGNGFTFPPSEEEVFTNGSYLVYDPSGDFVRISLPVRGPGSGRGRKIIWHSNKWDRLLMIDEFASGALLVKASNGIVVDSIVSSSLDPGKPLRILSASGDNRQKWMATHVRVGEKNAITLWAMPETKEVTSEMFATTDIAVKQMPMSPWAIVIPFVSSTDGGNALYAWDSQDVLSVDENEMHDASISPLPATDYINIAAQGMEGNVRYAVTSVDGQTLLAGNSSMYDGACRLEVNTLPAGVYVCTLKTENAFTTTRFIKQ